MLPARPITTPTAHNTARISCQRPRRQLAATAANDAALETKCWLDKVPRCCSQLLVGSLNPEFGGVDHVRDFNDWLQVLAAGRIGKVFCANKPISQ